VYGKPNPERHFRFWRLKFPVLRNKFSVLPKKFPVPFRREFGCKRLNLRADWGVKITDAVISGSLALASLNHTCRNLVPTFPQRSPPSLLTTAACGGFSKLAR
jgi:hypothetical protein